ncbi:BEN domain-containing protein 7 isoform X1 [Latimeria chalumnae]|uniref:BEN domain-containing protein 7 isoform X1 n=1 Tax=Latimeria chalumnae TaxID=7897 RepID=UPI0006D91605|nr:PREDICTED: BEN domain-containing protein 7 isoform X1 [Latimeria chalumnae]|eukprot:XP_014353000.1 PREDICTED: BEN domain-containing protein 7 isoform X1 [Latimeria chalumnae]
MEFSKRKRSRKSQSFKLVNEEYQEEYDDSDDSSKVNGESNNALLYTVGDENMEIRKQITGMRRLLNDKAGRIYQRVGKEGEKLKEEPQDPNLEWAENVTPQADSQAVPALSQNGTWNDIQTQATQFSGHYGTRSKTLKSRNQNVEINGEIPVVNSSVGPNCCMCNCQSALQAILLELKTMRKLMQAQAASQSQMQCQAAGHNTSRSAVSRKKNKKKRPPCKIAAPATLNKKISNQCISPVEYEKKQKPGRERVDPQGSGQVQAEESQVSSCEIVCGSSTPEPEVQLAEGFDVFIAKSQLDSILSNYTRSGSLLFRKLVSAFFDDTILANSLPNGKRKRGLNDNRKGLDQNIVGAIKVFTENYCTANHIDKLPGRRDWVQILQDQIKLARRRLKRGSGGTLETSTDVPWLPERDFKP